MNATADDDSMTQMTFCYHVDLRNRFMEGRLCKEWAARYPLLFDQDDLEICLNQCGRGYHFHEWLGAILLHEATGYRSLIQKYWSKSHSKKISIWEKVVPEAVREIPHEYGWPDLFMYAPDGSDWFFCETKGADRLSEAQRNCFRALHRESNKKVTVLWFRELCH